MQKKQTILLIRILLFVGTITSLFFVPWIIVWAWLLPLPNTVQEQLDQSISLGFDGIIVYVDEAESSPELYAAGWHDRKNNIPANPNALFKIASINKLYLAVAATKLVKENRLSLDQSLAEYLPNLKGRIENAESITLRMMLQHRSGIPNFTDHPGFWGNPPASKDEALELAFDLPALFKPNEDYAYCNTNYVLIADIIDKTLGYNHARYIKEKILIPLDLNHTFSSLNDVNIEDVMGGYYVGIEADLKTENPDVMLSTAHNLGVFLRALNDGSIFDEGEQEIYSSVYVYNHTGLIPGYQSIANYHPDIDAVIIQFNNITNFDGYEWNLAEIAYNRIAEIVRDQKS